MLRPDPRQSAQWVPLMIEGRKGGQKLAATRSQLGTDCEWGEVTRQYIRSMQGKPGVTLALSLVSGPDGKPATPGFTVESVTTPPVPLPEMPMTPRQPAASSGKRPR